MKIAYVVVAACVCACGSVNKVQPDAPPVPMPPQIDSLAPTKGIDTTPVTITGSHFGAAPGTVTVAGQTATVTSWSDTSIAMQIPDALPGDVDVVVTTADGASPAAKFTVILPPAIYVDNGIAAADGFDTVSALAFDPASGAVTQIGQPVSLGVAPSGYGGCSTSVWIHAHTRHLFATGQGRVAIYNINPVTGGLTAIAGSPFDAGGGRSFAVVTNAAGNRMWVTNYDGKNVGVFDLAANGAPTPVTGSPFAGTIATDTMTLSKDETHLFVNSYGTSYTGFSVDSTGALLPLAATNTGGTGIMRRPGTDQLFIPTETNTLAVWTAAGDGTVTQLPGSPFSTGTTTGIVQTGAFTPDGSKVYFSVYNTALIAGFSVATDGTPTALAGSPWTLAGNFSSCTAITQDASYLIATNSGGSSIAVFKLDATGTPTAATGSPFAFLPASTAANGLAISF